MKKAKMRKQAYVDPIIINPGAPKPVETDELA
jgi:hypothetical protein